MFTALISCSTSLNAQTKSQDQLKVERLSFNTDQDEFAPVLHSQGLVFVSSRKNSHFNTNFNKQGELTSDLFYVVYKDGKYLKETQLDQVLSSELSEGPACFSSNGSVIYYTGNIENEKGELVLGIFTAEKYDLSWRKQKISFRHNSLKAKYNVCHPHLTGNDSILYFSSDMPGGYGGFDIYYSKLSTEGVWADPVNLGSKVNTSGNEAYPFISNSYELYFASDGYPDNKDVDIMRALPDESGLYGGTKRLEEPINSDSRDFGYVIERNGQMAYFSSDRKRSSNLDIYSVQLEPFTFDNCVENYNPVFCYHFEDLNREDQHDELKTVWEFSNGEIIENESFDYCFEDYGKYEILMYVMDLRTGDCFSDTTKIEIDIPLPTHPRIIFPDTVKAGQSYNGFLEDIDFLPFETKEFYWDCGTPDIEQGIEVPITFETAGLQRLYVGSHGYNMSSEKKVCVYKDVEVLPIKKAFKSYKKIKD